MKNSRRLMDHCALSLSVLALIAACAPADKDSGSMAGYLPQPGDEAIAFTHRFNDEDYEEGQRQSVAQISAAIGGSRHTRRTGFFHSADKSEFAAISFFYPDSSSEECLAHNDREAVMMQPRPRAAASAVQWCLADPKTNQPHPMM